MTKPGDEPDPRVLARLDPQIVDPARLTEQQRLELTELDQSMASNAVPWPIRDLLLTMRAMRLFAQFSQADAIRDCYPAPTHDPGTDPSAWKTGFYEWKPGKGWAVDNRRVSDLLRGGRKRGTPGKPTLVMPEQKLVEVWVSKYLHALDSADSESSDTPAGDGGAAVRTRSLRLFDVARQALPGEQENTIGELRGQVAALEQQLRDGEEHVAELGRRHAGEIERLHADNARFVEQAKDTAQDCDELIEEVKSLEKQLALAVELKDAWSQHAADAQEEAAQLRRSLQALQPQLQAQAEQAADHVDEVVEELTRHQEAHSEVISEAIARIEDQVKDVKPEFEQIRKRLATMIGQLDGLQAQHAPTALVGTASAPPSAPVVDPADAPRVAPSVPENASNSFGRGDPPRVKQLDDRPGFPSNEESRREPPRDWFRQEPDTTPIRVQRRPGQPTSYGTGTAEPARPAQENSQAKRPRSRPSVSAADIGCWVFLGAWCIAAIIITIIIIINS